MQEEQLNAEPSKTNVNSETKDSSPPPPPPPQDASASVPQVDAGLTQENKEQRPPSAPASSQSQVRIQGVNPPQNTDRSKQKKYYNPINGLEDYKFSDFPSFFTGGYRYTNSPVKRKPFTIAGEEVNPSNRTGPQPDKEPQPGSTPASNTASKTSVIEDKWILKGGKLIRRSSARINNGLQDIYYS